MKLNERILYTKKQFLLKRTISNLKAANLPFFMSIQLTGTCQQNCIYCNYYGQLNRTPEELKFSYLKDIIKKNDDKVIEFYFYGGEPFLYSDIYSLLSIKRKSFLSIDTNGQNVPIEVINIAIKNNLTALLFSIHGDEKIHTYLTRKKNSFKRTIKTIKSIEKQKKNFKSHYPHIIINSVITFDNFHALHKIPEIIKDIDYRELIFINQEYINNKAFLDTARIFWQEFGIRLNKNDFKNVIFSKRLENNKIILSGADHRDIVLKSKDYMHRELNRIQSNTRINFQKLNKRETAEYFWDSNYRPNWAEERICRGPFTMMIIDNKGNVSTCPGLKAGNIYQQDIGDIWQGKIYKELREYIRANKHFPYCRICPYYYK